MAGTPELLNRPLKENPGIVWDGALVGVQRGRHTDTFGYQWLLRGRQTGIVGGDVTVVFSEGIILVNTKRPFTDREEIQIGGQSLPILIEKPLARELSTPEKVLQVLDSYGWGEPPHFDLVCSAIPDIKAVKDQGGDKEGVRRALRDKALTWQDQGVKIYPSQPIE